MASIQDIRNIVFLGHGGAGKTSLVEAILHITGKINRLGTIDDKNTVCDFNDEEKQRGNSIRSAIAYTEHEGKTVNMIDTPGYPGFIAGALQSIPAGEASIVVISAAAGIEVNTRKLFAASKNAGKPIIIVVNKIDAENVDTSDIINSIQEMFGPECKCANLPADDKGSVIDCVINETGDCSAMDVAEAHMELLETIIEADDDVMEAYLSGDEVTPDQIASVFVKALAEGTIVPIIFTDSRKEIGIKELLDLVVKIVPSPDKAKPAILIDGEEEKEIAADPNGPLAGQVIRVGFDPRSNMKYSTIRMFSGKLDPHTNLFINNAKKGIRPGHPIQMQGGDAHEIDTATAGQIVSLAKLDELKLGDLVHDGKMKGKFPMPPFPKPMFALAMEPASRGDENKIGAALDKLCEEDACFTVHMDSQTHERVISGLGDLHLRVMLSEMENRYKVKVNTKQPKIPYHETILAKAEGHYRHKKQSGGAGQFGEVYLRIEPGERDSDPSMEFSWDIFGGSIPGQFEPAVIKGINDVMSTGVLAGFPLQDVKVSVYDGKYHAVDSKEVAFRAAGKGAFIDAVKNAKPSLLEPIVHMEVTVPADNMGDITGDLAGRRGRIEGQDMLPGNMVIIKALVPLSEVTQYNSQLKSVTGGQGSYSMELSHYDPTPPNIQQQVIAQYQAEKNKEE
ncbi:MAG: elongation factor G [Planctomycetes bacterium]|nr:elongation factor G [Planctomycetota bacterium]